MIILEKSYFIKEGEKVIVCVKYVFKVFRAIFLVCAYFQWEVMQGNRGRWGFERY